MARKRRQLSPEDRALWDRFKQSAVPLDPQNKVVTPKPATPRPKPSAAPQPIVFGTARPSEPLTRFMPAPDPKKTLTAARTDGKTQTRMRQGKLSPDARIDLHGMTAERAKSALTGFLLQSSASGCRMVLVITGKGRAPKEDRGPIPQPHGILRNAVPQWLAMSPLSSVVLQIMPAHQKHGGGGAIYVYLRRVR